MKLLDTGKITALRKQRGWGQYELAEAAGVNPSVISRMERDLQTDFKLSVVISVAEALGTNIEHLLITQGARQEQRQQFIDELDVTLRLLSEESAEVQRQVSGIIRGYLSTLEK